MDAFTQRMLERARARQEKIDQKLANSGLAEPRRKPLSENVNIKSSDKSPCKVSSNESVLSPKKTSRDSSTPKKVTSRESLTPKKVTSPRRVSQDKTDSPVKSTRRSIKKTDSVSSPQRLRNDVIVTRQEFNTPRKAGVNRQNSDVSVEINIMHRDDIQIEVQVEEHDVPLNVVYDDGANSGNSTKIQEIEDTEKMDKAIMGGCDKMEKSGLRQNVKSRLDRLGNLYSDKPTLSSPIHRTEGEFSAATPPRSDGAREKPRGARKFGRLAALADQINNWEDDLTHHANNPPDPKKGAKSSADSNLESSTLDVSVHSIKDINKALSTAAKSKSTTSKLNSHTFTRPQGSANECQCLRKQIVAELESEGYRRVSAGQSRLVYEFTESSEPARQEPRRLPKGSTAATPDMAALVAGGAPAIAKKPSIKKYKAPTPPQIDSDESDKDKENNVISREVNDNDVQTKSETDKPAPSSPAVRRLAGKHGHNDRGSVLSKAAMFEAGSPRAKEKDPAEMSLRERKALFEKNKGAAIIPKAPFGLAPSVKTLQGENKVEKISKPVVQKVESNPKVNSAKDAPSKDEDTVSQSSLGGGIKGKLAALFNKEQTISEATITNKFKQERDKEMEMLQNRFQYKPKPDSHPEQSDSDNHSEDENPSEKAPLMGSTPNLLQNNQKKPEIVANIPKLDKTKSQTSLRGEVDDEKAASQPVKRRSSQDSPVVLSVLDDVKRIKVNATKKDGQTNGAVTAQPSLYPHLSDIETDTSHTQEEFSDCGGSSQDDEPPAQNLNKSANWADTSFGREVMNVVKRNNSSYQKAVRSDSESSGAAGDSELDDMLDEALNEAEGPTPPKLNKATLSSNSFVYEERKKFKSPLKCEPTTPATPRPDKGSELVHSVSFYRRAQNNSTPSTPFRSIRHASPERPAEADPSAGVTTVRRRIKELQAETAKQQTVISQASQALNLCASTIEFSGSTEQAEGERLLLLATHRRQACQHEVQRLQVEGAGAAGAPGIAQLHIHGVSVPLKREYMRRLNADGAVGHHAVCLLKCRDRVLATSMQLTSPSSNVLEFPDEIHMEGLASDFKVTIEVYLLQASKEVLPHDVKYHIFSKKSNSKLLTPSKSKIKSNPELKAPRVQSPAGPLSVRSPQFQLHGYCIFALPQATRKNFTLNKIPGGSPLEGSINVSITPRVVVAPPGRHAAFLTAFDDVSGLGAWHRRWFVLQAPVVSYWKYPDDVARKMPIGSIDLTTVLSDKVTRAARDLCARPNTLVFECAAPAGAVPDAGSLVIVRRPDGTLARRHLLAADTPQDRDTWLETLNKALEYVRCTYSEESDH